MRARAWARARVRGNSVGSGSRARGAGGASRARIATPRTAAHSCFMSREKLRVEIKAEELVAEIARVLRRLRYRCNASKHLEKAGDSILLNLGEGTVAYKPRLKAAKYDISRGEAREVQRAARALVLKGKLTTKDVEKIDDLTDCLIGSLTKMIKGLEDKM